MALAVTIDERDVWGSHLVRLGSAQFDAAYVTGGEPVTAADFQLVQLVDLVITSTDDASQRAVFDRANSKVKLYVEDGTSGIEAEEGSTDDASAVNFRFIAIGK